MSNKDRMRTFKKIKQHEIVQTAEIYEELNYTHVPVQPFHMFETKREKKLTEFCAVRICFASVVFFGIFLTLLIIVWTKKSRLF